MWVVLDFETASGCDLKRCGADIYAQDPTTEILCCGYRVSPKLLLAGSEEVLVWTPQTGIDSFLTQLASNPEVTFIAHNVTFERAIWRQIMVGQFGFPAIADARWVDTMATCAERSLPLPLGKVAAVLRLQVQKDLGASRFTVGLSRTAKDGNFDRSPISLARVYAYNKQDVLTQTTLWNRLGPLTSKEKPVWLLDQTINQRGVLIDRDFVLACKQVVARYQKPAVAEFRELTGGLNPTQRDKVLVWLRDNGVHLVDLQKETISELLNEDESQAQSVEDSNCDDMPALPDKCRRVLKLRQLCSSTAVKKLERMLACQGPDGRVRGLLQYHGATTGRWSGRLIQPQNFPRGTIKSDPDVAVKLIRTGDLSLIQACLGEPMDVITSALRHAIIAAPGHRLLIGDYAGIEARIVLALAGQHDKTAIMAAGKDVYLDMAESIFGESGLTKEKDPEKRQIGKNSVLGLGFGMGWRTFQTRYASDQPGEFAQTIVNIYRKTWAPKVPILWYALELAAARAVHERRPFEASGVEFRLEDEWLTGRLPSGRKLWYYGPEPTRTAMPWDDTDVRLSWTCWSMKLGQWRQRNMYGGLLTENVVQALARDLMVHGMMGCERENLPIVLTVHDEIITEPKSARADPKLLQQIMSDIPAWARYIQVPVAAECWTGERYKK